VRSKLTAHGSDETLSETSNAAPFPRLAGGPCGHVGVLEGSLRFRPSGTSPSSDVIGVQAHLPPGGSLREVDLALLPDGFARRPLSL